ncbi:MAG: porphobilinogen synthase [Rikenellaceae bacterium]|jgi:porphobilinogen synthase|nr:porphobilinogen synthase [Rikenellaceae bacterium]
MQRFRYLRASGELRDHYAEVSLAPGDFIYPCFVVEGRGAREPIASMPDIYRLSIDRLLDEVGSVLRLGIDKILLFGVIPPEKKDERGTAGFTRDSLVCRAVREVKQAYPEAFVITDVCLCEYTSHGHCGLLHGDDVENDATLPLLAEMALQHALAGADCVAPSAMMDGQVEAIRRRLDGEKLTKTRIMGYSAKYASSLYGPFRDAAASAPAFGDRKGYQMDYRTMFQGIQEIAADVEEGADYVMVKPALAYLDMIARASALFRDTPIVAYQVSGEYSMLRLGAAAGLFDERRIFHEALTAIKRAGAGLIISYYAPEFVRGL